MQGKYWFSLVFLVGTLFLANSANAAYKPTDKYDYHYISPGETLRSIARSYYGDELDFRPIVKLNNIADPDLIIAGQTLKIELLPVVETAAPANPPANPVINQPAPVRSAAQAIEPALPKPAEWRGWRWGAVYASGGGLVQGGTDFMVGPIVLNASAGIGFGKNYAMANFQLSKEFELPGDCRLGFSGVYAYYSKYITDVPWINGQVLNKGANLSLGIYVSKDVNKWEIKAGYSPILGPNLGVSRYL